MEIRELNARLARQVESVVSHLLPQGVRKGNEYVAGSTSGEKGTSLSIHLTGSKAGIWSDFATGEKGDLVELWRVVKGLTLVEALRQVKDYLGIQDVAFAPVKKKEYVKPVKPKVTRITAEAEQTKAMFEYLTEVRKFSPASIEAYRIRLGYYNNGKMLCYMFPMERDGVLVNIKYVRVEKNEKGKHPSWFNPGSELCLIGWHQVDPNSRSIIITEGQWDMVAWHEYGFTSLSVPNGANPGWIENEYDNLDRFETIYTNLDTEEKTKAVTAKIVERLGAHRCKIVTLPFKDANECLQKGVTKEDMALCLETAEIIEHSKLKTPLSYGDVIIDRFYPTAKTDFDTPWHKLRGKLSFRPGEITIWAGYLGHGKTTFLSQVLLSGIAQDEKVCLVSLEISPAASLEKMVRQATAQTLPAKSLIAQSLFFLEEKLWLYDDMSTINPDSLLEAWVYARRRYNITQFALDNLMCVGIGEEDYSEQKVFLNKLREFAIKENVHVHLVCHARKGTDDGTSPRSFQVKGSSAITSLAHNVITIWRDMEKHLKVSELIDSQTVIPDDLYNKPDATLSCDKQRHGTSWVGRVFFWFDIESQQYLESIDGKPLIYVKGDA